MKIGMLNKMIKKFNDFLIVEDNNNNVYNVVISVDSDTIRSITGLSNIIESIKQQLNWIDTLNILNIDHINDNDYVVKIFVNNNILDKTDKSNYEDAIYDEFNWLIDSGIKIKKIYQE
jgi:hypothetical protein